MDVDLLDGSKIKNYWCIFYIVFIIDFFCQLFQNVRDELILIGFINASVLSLIIAFKLMEFENRVDKLKFLTQQQTALNILTNYIIFKKITVNEHNNLFINDSIFND